MTEIIPRWEWRSFGRRLGEAEAKLTKLLPDNTQESDEIYLLSAHGENVKIRGGLIDVKILQEIGPEGLERWTPVMKAEFPLTVADVAKVAGALHLSVPTLPQESVTLEAFLDLFAGNSNGVRAVEVHKRRMRYTIGGCRAELSDVTANGSSTRTIAVESENAAAVLRTVADLGLSANVNTSYPRALRCLIDDKPERFAVIDVGTNSVKLHLGERLPSGEWRSVADFAEVTRLGEGLAQAGRIGEAPLERTIEAIAKMAEEIRSLGALAIVAVGTAALRTASNRVNVLDTIQARTGVRVEVLSGEEEARLAFLGAKSSLTMNDDTIVVFDTGGGSSQFTFGHGAAVDERFSVAVGAAVYTERFGLAHAVSVEELHAAVAAISADLSCLDGRQTPQVLVGMGGATTNIAAVGHGLTKYDPSAVQGTLLDRSEIDRQIELYRCRDAKARRAITGLQPDRAEVILAGVCIVRTVMEKLGKTSLVVSDRGLRHGVMTERFGA